MVEQRVQYKAKYVPYLQVNDRLERIQRVCQEIKRSSFNKKIQEIALKTKDHKT